MTARDRNPFREEPSARAIRRRVNPENRAPRLAAVATGVVVFSLLLIVLGTVGLQTILASGARTGTSAPGLVSPPVTTMPDSGVRYVALGDSYAAGPGLPPRGDGTAESCGRSAANYPAKVARLLGATTLLDVTCTGAMSPNLVTPQVRPDGTVLPPQIEAVLPETDLVTMSLGGNDAGTFRRLLDLCSEPEGEASAASDVPCHESLEKQGDSPLTVAEGLAERTERSVRRVRSAAPRALVVVVGYPQMFPSSGTCDALGMSPPEVAYVGGYITRVNRALAAGAERSGAVFIDLAGPSTGHDICSDRPWVAGRDTGGQPGRAWHLYERGMGATARIVQAALAPRQSADAGD